MVCSHAFLMKNLVPACLGKMGFLYRWNLWRFLRLSQLLYNIEYFKQCITWKNENDMTIQLKIKKKQLLPFTAKHENGRYYACSLLTQTTSNLDFSSTQITSIERVSGIRFILKLKSNWIRISLICNLTLSETSLVWWICICQLNQCHVFLRNNNWFHKFSRVRTLTYIKKFTY